jgi:hypothetical protein
MRLALGPRPARRAPRASREGPGGAARGERDEEDEERGADERWKRGQGKDIPPTSLIFCCKILPWPCEGRLAVAFLACIELTYK